MALSKKARTISVADIRPGQVLEIEYDGDRDLILVVDPKSTSNTNPEQSRPGKLHAIKLINFVDSDLINLVRELRSGGTRSGTVTRYTPSEIHDKFKNSKYVGRRNWRSYSPEKIGTIKRITVGQDAPKSNKIKIGNSILYGCEHGKYVQIAFTEYDNFVNELKSVNFKTFHEGPRHEAITEELMQATGMGDILRDGETWEPDPMLFKGMVQLGYVVAGWWNQDLPSKTALDNILNVWNATGLSLQSPIGEVFKKSIGDDNYNFVIKNFTSYYKYGRYSKSAFLATLSQPGFTDKGKPTSHLMDFNNAGHDQVFPEDQNGLLPGPLKSAEQVFNNFRREHLKQKMENNPGIYFCGAGHMDEMRKMV